MIGIGRMLAKIDPATSYGRASAVSNDWSDEQKASYEDLQPFGSWSRSSTVAERAWKQARISIRGSSSVWTGIGVTSHIYHTQQHALRPLWAFTMREEETSLEPLVTPNVCGLDWLRFPH